MRSSKKKKTYKSEAERSRPEGSRERKTFMRNWSKTGKLGVVLLAGPLNYPDSLVTLDTYISPVETPPNLKLRN